MAYEECPFSEADKQAGQLKNGIPAEQVHSILFKGENPSLWRDNKPVTPVHLGKRSVPHAGEHNSAPFATYDGKAMGTVESVQGGQMTKSYQARHHKKEGAGKISSTEYNAEVYRQAIVSNAANLSQQKTRNWGQQGLLGQHPATPPGALPAVMAEEEANPPEGYY